MSVGGYKIAKYTFTGDGSNWNGIETAVEITATMKQNCRSILIGCAKALMQANSQWIFDTNQPSTDTGNITINTTDAGLDANILPRILESYITRVTGDFYNYSCGVYLKNNTTQTKILMVYFANSYKKPYSHSLSPTNINNAFYSLNNSYNVTNTYRGLVRVPIGLSIAMIPAESNSDWTSYDWTADNWCSSSMISPYSYSYTYSPYSGSYSGYFYECSCIGIKNSSDIKYSWSFIAKEDNIGVFLRANSWENSNAKGYIIGKLFQNIEESDDYHYGFFSFMPDLDENINEYSNPTLSTTAYCKYLSTYKTSGIEYNPFILNTSVSNTPSIRPTAMQCFTSSKSILGGLGYSNCYNGNVGTTILTSCGGISALGIQLENKRFFQLGIGIYEQAVRTNDGFKGWIDSDFLRVVYNPGPSANSGWYNTSTAEPFAKGRTFDNGNFMYIGGGLCIGWDSSNTLSPFDNNMPQS